MHEAGLDIAARRTGDDRSLGAPRLDDRLLQLLQLLGHDDERVEVVGVDLVPGDQPEQQAEVFIEDCRVKYHLTDWIVGRKDLTEALVTALARYAKTSHHLSNIEIDFDGPDSATAQSAVIAWHRRHDGSELTLPCVSMFRMRHGLVADYRIYMDANPVFTTQKARYASSFPS